MVQMAAIVYENDGYIFRVSDGGRSKNTSAIVISS
jgi:hypothetical protein